MSDDEMWAAWFNSHAWASVWSKLEDHDQLKVQVDYMSRQRLTGIAFMFAAHGYGKDRNNPLTCGQEIVPVLTTEQMVEQRKGAA